MAWEAADLLPPVLLVLLFPDHPTYGYFTVTMTKIRMENSGIYLCGIQNAFLRSIYLLVSPASIASTTTRSTRRTTAWTSVTNPVTGSLSGNWKFIAACVVVAALLLGLGLGILILCLKKAQGRAGKGEDESYHVYDNHSSLNVETMQPDQQMDPVEDMGALCYASLTHLNCLDTEDPIYINTYPTSKPTPDLLLSVEYASITAKRPQPSMSAALEVELEGEPSN
ncbi:uncharacterized protein LOC132538209 [Erinaceus europaeus]|uniref:Uncharacterized protein LOC132538209 n=1 Tax=Erinaceus europaeus TaxID=9365 RepID=A0ABM3XDB1_ERIEU|nr:uncharacterized protein LOC132538209 [Erinaceus europaeus]